MIKNISGQITILMLEVKYAENTKKNPKHFSKNKDCYIENKSN